MEKLTRFTNKSKRNWSEEECRVMVNAALCKLIEDAGGVITISVAELFRIAPMGSLAMEEAVKTVFSIALVCLMAAAIIDLALHWKPKPSAAVATPRYVQGKKKIIAQNWSMADMAHCAQMINSFGGLHDMMELMVEPKMTWTCKDDSAVLFESVNGKHICVRF